MRSNRGVTLISVLVIMLAIITAILVTVEVIVIINDIKKEEEKVIISQGEKITDQEKEDNDIEKIEEENENRISEETINKWVGKYENENVTVDIWRESVDQLFVSIIKLNDGSSFDISSSSFYITVDTETTELIHTSEMFDETDNVIITYMDNGIKLDASSTGEESLLNEIDGEYERKNFEKSGWDGVYINGETTVILSEVFEEELMISIEQGYSSFSNSIDEYTKQKIEHDDFGDEIFIEKTNKGIRVQAASTEEDDLLNRINGEYVKQD